MRSDARLAVGAVGRRSASASPARSGLRRRSRAAPWPAARRSPARPWPPPRRTRGRRAAAPIWLAQATSWLVSPAMAETTTATWLPASTSRLTSLATFRMRSRSATDVPPNFMTIRAIFDTTCGRQGGGRAGSAVAGTRAGPYILGFGDGEASAAAPDFRMTATAASIDPAEVARFSRHGRGMVGPGRQVPRRCTAQPGPARASSATGGRPFRPRPAGPAPVRGAAPARHRLRRRAGHRADGAAGLRGRPASTPRTSNVDIARAACRAGRPGHRLPQRGGRGPGRGRRALRRGSGAGSGRARRRSRQLPRRLRAAAEARRR